MVHDVLNHTDSPSQCCAMRWSVGGSVQFVKVPSHLAIPVPCDENRAAASMDDGDQGWCGEPRLSDIQSSGPNGLTSWKSESTEQTYPGTIALLVMSLSMKRATLFIWCTPICTKVQHRSSCTVWGHVDEDCHGQPLARPHEEGCHIALNGRHHFPLNFLKAIAGVEGIGMSFIRPTKVAAPMKDNACERSITPAVDVASAKIPEPEGLFGISF
jgi:hypothetical protein